MTRSTLDTGMTRTLPDDTAQPVASPLVPPALVVSRPVDVSTCAKGHFYDDGVCVYCGADGP